MANHRSRALMITVVLLLVGGMIGNSPAAAGCVDATCAAGTCSANTLQSCNDTCDTGGYQLTLTILDARCADAGGNCPAPGNCVGDLYGRVQIDQTGLTVPDLPIAIHICQEWVDCSGSAVCTACESKTITALNQLPYVPPALQCNRGGSTYQYQVKMHDQGGASGSCSTQGTCPGSCACWGACQSPGPAKAASCCVP